MYLISLISHIVDLRVILVELDELSLFARENILVRLTSLSKLKDNVIFNTFSIKKVIMINFAQNLLGGF